MNVLSRPRPRHAAPRIRRHRLKSTFLPPTSAGRWLMVAFFVDTLGTGLFIAGSMIFFTRGIGLSAGQVTSGLSLAALTGMVASVPMGVLADRHGVRRVQVILHLSRALGFVLYASVGTYWQFLLVACLIGVGDRTSPALNQALVTLSVAATDRVRTMGLLRVTKNVSFTIGGLLAAAVLAADSVSAYTAVVLVNAASFVAVAVLIGRLPLIAEAARPADARPAAPWWRLPALRDRRYLNVTVANCLLCFHNTLLIVGVPLLVLERTDAPAALVAALFVLNTVLVVAAQVRIGHLVERPGIAATFRLTGLALAMACLLAVAATYADGLATIVLLIAVVVVLSLGEMMQSAAGWEVSFRLAPVDRQAEYLTVFNLGSTVESIAGPVVIGAALLGGGIPFWAAAAVIFALAGLWSARLTRRMPVAA